MKKSDLPNIITSFFLSFFIGLAGISCLLTAFTLRADLFAICVVALVVALITAVALSFRFGWITLCAAGLAGVLFLFTQGLWDQCGSLLVAIFNRYDQVYDMGIPLFLFDCVEGEVTLPSMLIAGLATLAAGVSLRRGRVAGALIAAMVPFIPCLLGQDNLPNPIFLFLLLACVLLLVLTKEVRKRNPEKAGNLMALFMGPTFLTLFLLFLVNPSGSYVAPDRSKGLIEAFLDRMQKLVLVQDETETADEMEWEILTDTADSDQYDQILVVNDSTIRLNYIGSKSQSQKAVLEVSSTLTGTMYLRERGYGKYTGIAWLAPNGRERFGIGEEDLFLFRAGLGKELWIVDLHDPIKTQNYLPYYSATDVHLIDGYGENFSGVNTQDYLVNPLNSEWKDLWREKYSMNLQELKRYWPEVYPVYYTLTGDTQSFAQKFVEENFDLTKDVVTVADEIGDYVRSIGRYNEKVGRVPTGTEDFVQFFMKYSKTGYCVHYASTAAVLLRAAGIPARYVEGYVFDAVAGQTTTVTEKNMHAWVEYYLPDVGWVILEVTPGQEQIPLEMDPNDPNIPEKPDSSKPEDPEDPEDPDDPIAGQEPDEPDVDAPDTPDVPEEGIPDEEKKDETPEEKEPPIWVKLWPILRIPLLILAILCVIFGQWRLRVMRRRKRLNKGRHNRRGQYHWRYLVKLFRLLKETPPEACRELAQKARFSQHTLSDEELRSLEAVEKETIQRLRKKGILWRFVYTIILAAY